jgi:hypothetical protein
MKPAVQAGHTMTEYMVMCAALAFFLFVPIQDNPASPDQPRTTLQILIDGFASAYQKFSYAISLPN